MDNRAKPREEGSTGKGLSELKEALSNISVVHWSHGLKGGKPMIPNRHLTPKEERGTQTTPEEPKEEGRQKKPDTCEAASQTELAGQRWTDHPPSQDQNFLGGRDSEVAGGERGEQEVKCQQIWEVMMPEKASEIPSEHMPMTLHGVMGDSSLAMPSSEVEGPDGANRSLAKPSLQVEGPDGTSSGSAEAPAACGSDSDSQ